MAFVLNSAVLPPALEELSLSSMIRLPGEISICGYHTEIVYIFAGCVHLAIRLCSNSSTPVHARLYYAFMAAIGNSLNNHTCNF